MSQRRFEVFLLVGFVAQVFLGFGLNFEENKNLLKIHNLANKSIYMYCVGYISLLFGQIGARVGFFLFFWLSGGMCGLTILLGIEIHFFGVVLTSELARSSEHAMPGPPMPCRRARRPTKRSPSDDSIVFYSLRKKSHLKLK